MSRKKSPADAASAAEGPDVFDEAIANQQAATPSQESPTDNAGGPDEKRPWAQRFPFWRDNEAGVRIEEDRKNKLTSVIFRDKVPAKAQQTLTQAGYVKEDDHIFSKKLDTLRTHEHREQAENVVLEVANILRAEKGLPERKSFYISRS